MMNPRTSGSFPLFHLDDNIKTACSVDDLDPLPIQTRVTSYQLLEALAPLDSSSSSSSSTLSQPNEIAPKLSPPTQILPSAHLDFVHDKGFECLDKVPISEAFDFDWKAIELISSRLQEQQKQLNQLYQHLSSPQHEITTATSVRSSTDLDENDIVCARGKFMYNHPGCVRFRGIVRSFIPQYEAALTRVDKSQVIDTIIEATLTPGTESGGNTEARFVKLDAGHWCVLTRQQIRDKVGHALRESIHEQSRQSQSRRHIQRLAHIPL